MHSAHGQPDPRRTTILLQGEPGPGPVVYWMSREQRIYDNWALLQAQARALEAGRGLVILFCLQPAFKEATWRQYAFMLQGLQETCRDSLKLGMPFVVRYGDPGVVVPGFVQELQAHSLVCDFDPLRIKSKWRSAVAQKVVLPLEMVDGHNIVPCWETSGKQEYAARTIRPKIQKKLLEFLDPFPDPVTHPYPANLELQEPDWNAASNTLQVDVAVPPVDWLKPGPRAARKVLADFLQHRLQDYAQKSNDPNSGAVSHLSPYLHFGQIAAQRAAWEVWNQPGEQDDSKQAFLEQLIVRRELADNYCWYNAQYDSFAGLPEWSRKTLNAHRGDMRSYLYSLQQLETAATHDDLWNAAQNEMRLTGKMHGYLRMYWAKKILEWSASPEQAIEAAIKLNDRYELDGRDPNGYAGVLWAVGGLHDHGFKQRQVLGTVRYMSYAGCKRKFNVRAYVRRFAVQGT